MDLKELLFPTRRKIAEMLILFVMFGFFIGFFDAYLNCLDYLVGWPLPYMYAQCTGFPIVITDWVALAVDLVVWYLIASVVACIMRKIINP